MPCASWIATWIATRCYPPLPATPYRGPFQSRALPSTPSYNPEKQNKSFFEKVKDVFSGG